MKMWRLLTTVLLVALCCNIGTAAKPRDINKVKKEQQAAKKQIKEASRKLDENTKRTQQNLTKLNQLSGEITTKNKEITAMKAGIDSLDSRIRSASDSVTLLNNRLEELRRSYNDALRSMQGTGGATDVLGFVFSSESFSKAYARIRYMQEFSRWCKRKCDEIERTAQDVSRQKSHLGELNRERKQSLAQLNTAQSRLETKRAETDRLVTKLKKEGGTLKAVLKKNEQRLRQLDRDLDRLIAEEQRRQEQARRAEAKKQQQKGKSTGAGGKSNKGGSTQSSVVGIADADRAMNGSFESNRGKLLFPVRGQYTVVRGFGRQKHPELEHVETDNPGIDIATSAGAKARTIFSGKVSGVFRQDGYNIVVMVRHGSYISIYANLSSVYVKVGDSVKANQDIGSIYADPSNGNRPVLHFELRKERAKLNPMLWVR